MNKIILHDPTDKVWLIFENPIAVFKTTTTEDVLPVLEKVEDMVNSKGYFAAGFLSYEASPAFDSALKTFQTTAFPLICFGVFEVPPKRVQWEELISNHSASDLNLNFQLPFSKNQYKKQLSKVRDYIHKGDTYQVNFTFRQRAEFNANPFQLFEKIGQNALYGAYLELEDFAIASASPELFFRVEGEALESRPMKGTIQRGRTLSEDLFFKNQLKKSQKDRSENVMIVDMIRNDVGKIAETGTVETPKLFEVEKHPTVWQMTSTVKARTKASFTEILKALYPCASITGAPKVRTMEIINNLEESPRNIYCGTIGYLAPGGKMQFSVAIRTALFNKKRNQVEYGIGGGITWYSNSEQEFEEAILKSKIIRKRETIPAFSLLETILWTPDNGYFLLEEHLKRMADSAKYFDYKIDLEKIRLELNHNKTTFSSPLKVRLLASKNGKYFMEKKPLENAMIEGDPKFFPKVVLAKKPIDAANTILFHKTTHRNIYTNAKKDFPNHYDVLLWNQKGELTEGSFNNIVVRWNGKLFTPTVECGLLNGVFRQHLLNTGVIEEGIILKENLVEVEEIFLINSVRKWQKVQLEEIEEDALLKVM